MAIPLPISPNLSANRDRYPSTGDAWPCCVCGKPVNIKARPYWLRLLVGGKVVTTETDTEIPEGQDLGCHPIGADCLRRHPELKPWASR